MLIEQFYENLVKEKLGCDSVDEALSKYFNEFTEEEQRELRQIGIKPNIQIS